MTPVERERYQQGVRYHAPRRREPGPVLGVAASLLVLLVAGQVSLASARDDAGDAVPVSAPAATAPASPSTDDATGDATGGSTGDATADVTGETAEGAAVVELTFDSGADTPEPGAEDLLDQVAGRLRDDPDAMVRIVGHAEPSNDPDLEKQLSLERALRVVDLLGLRGVPSERVQVVAAGSTQAPSSDDGEAGNSRVTLEVTSG